MATMNKLLFSAASFFCFSFLRKKEKEHELFFVSLHPYVLLNRRPFVNAKVKVRQDVFC